MMLIDCKSSNYEMTLDSDTLNDLIEAIRRFVGERADSRRCRGAIIGFGNDSDGHLIKLIQKPAKS